MVFRRRSGVDDWYGGVLGDANVLRDGVWSVCRAVFVHQLWLVLYTWLQHTDVDVPHFEGDDWNLVKGAFMTIDRPYGKVYDFCTTESEHPRGAPH